jgi:metallo-beta-lactamase family protein
MKIQILGAAREVTGSKHLITTIEGKKILLDCGMYQGKGLETDEANRKLGFEPKEIDTLVLSHAHIDHSGLIPYLVKQGFTGNIICTHGTRDLCVIMLADCGRIQESDTRTHNKRRVKDGLPPLEPLYTASDAQQSLQQFVSISYNQDFRLTDSVKFRFTNTGHILGSSAVNLTFKENDKEIKLCFTADIGRPGNSILLEPQPFPQADYIIAESTYGDRLHDSRQDSEKKLLDVVVETCTKKRGKLIIPSFSVGRTQEIVYALHKLFNKGWLPRIKVYVDSPLSFNATNIMRIHPESFNAEITEFMHTDVDPFGFDSLTYIQTEDGSKKLNNSEEPCIIISASGMAEAGRVKHHIANSISNPRNTILFVGYCEPKTLGAKIKRGESEVSIFGTPYKVKAGVDSIEAFSAHADYSEMIVWLGCQDKTKIKKIFLVHGEYEAQQKYKQILEENRFTNIEIPEWGQEFILE